MATARKMNTWTPPFFSRRKLAVKPMLQKNTVIKTLCRVSVRLRTSTPLVLSPRLIRAKISPPMTGAGIQNLLKKDTFFLM